MEFFKDLIRGHEKYFKENKFRENRIINDEKPELTLVISKQDEIKAA